MIDFKEKYSKLYESVKDIPKRNLKVISTEERGDDLSCSIYPQFDNSDLSLLLLAQNIAPNGFVESYCLDEEELARINKIRKKLNDNPTWKDNLIETLEHYLPMPYEQFKKLPLGHQQRIISNIESSLNEEERTTFQQKFGNLADNKVRELKMN